MKQIFYLFIFLACCVQAAAQAPNLGWARKVGGTDEEFPVSLAVDASANVYTTGYFSSGALVDFDPGTFNYSLAAGSGTDMYITKFNPQGQFVWVKQINGPGALVKPQAIAIDPNGNVVVVGFFTGTIDFNPGMSVNNLTSPAGTESGFLLKLNPQGHYSFAKKLESRGTCRLNSLAIDEAGNINAGGTFTDSLDVNPHPWQTTWLVPSGSASDALFIQFTTGGAVTWARSLEGTAASTCNAITLVNGEEPLFTGTFNDNTDFDPGPGFFGMNSAGNKDVYFLRLNAAGDFGWAKSVGGTQAEEIFSISVAGGLMSAFGSFNGTADFNPATADSTLTASGGTNLFVLQLTDEGTFNWVRKIPVTQVNSLNSQRIGMDADLSTYLCGKFSNTVDFNPGPDTHNLSGSGSSDAFVLKLDVTGNFAWAFKLGSNSTDEAVSLQVGGVDILYALGNFRHTVNFSTGPLSVTLNSSNGPDTDVWVAKWQPCASGSVSITATGCGTYTSPSGQFVWTSSGTYQDTLLSSIGCDSLLTINLYIGTQPTYANWNVAACLSYTSPSGQYNWSLPGVYQDTITNWYGCDSVLSITLSIGSIDTYDSIAVNGCQQYLSPSGGEVWTTSGIYHDTIPNAGGCDSILTINLNMVTVNTNVTQAAGVLYASAVGANYQWIQCSPVITLISGATGSSYAPPSLGHYAVIVTQNGCADTSDCILLTAVDATSPVPVLPLRIQPNPATDAVTFTAGNEPLYHAALQLMDARGAEVAQQEWNGSSCSLSLEGLPPGIYLARVFHDDTIWTGRLIVQ